MQIFLKSRTVFFSKEEKSFLKHGFSLIELLVTMGIIAIVVSIVLIKYKNFDGTTLLKGSAYEIAMTLREAQIKSMSIAAGGGGTGAFDQPWGVSFKPGNGTTGKTYTLFKYKGASPTPSRTTPGDYVDVQTATVNRSMYVSAVCINGVCGSGASDQLDISFKRPEAKAYFYANIGGVSYASAANAIIKVTSTQSDSGIFLVKISSLGQVTVCKEGVVSNTCI